MFPVSQVASSAAILALLQASGGQLGGRGRHGEGGWGVVMVSGCHGDRGCVVIDLSGWGPLWMGFTWSRDIIILIVYLERLVFCFFSLPSFMKSCFEVALMLIFLREAQEKSTSRDKAVLRKAHKQK